METKIESLAKIKIGQLFLIDSRNEKITITDIINRFSLSIS